MHSYNRYWHQAPGEPCNKASARRRPLNQGISHASACKSCMFDNVPDGMTNSLSPVDSKGTVNTGPRIQLRFSSMTAFNKGPSIKLRFSYMTASAQHFRFRSVSSPRQKQDALKTSHIASNSMLYQKRSIRPDARVTFFSTDQQITVEKRSSCRRHAA